MKSILIGKTTDGQPVYITIDGSATPLVLGRVTTRKSSFRK
jgi:hypothetical protein